MKKRSGRKASNGDSLLPITASDAATADKKRKHGKRSRGGGSGGLCSTLFGITLVALVVVCLTIYYYGRADVPSTHPLKKYIHKLTKKTEKKKKSKADLKEWAHKVVEKERLMKEVDGAKGTTKTASQENLPLSEYTSLRYAFENSDLVLLYFAASWCSTSKPVTDQIDSLFRDLLLPPPEEGDDSKKDAPKRMGMSLVFVSSDRSQEAMEDYLRENWIAVPFESPERDNLKRHFKTWSKPETANLGSEREREREIPALIVLSSATHQVLTTEGVDHVADKGQRAVEYWMTLLGEEQERQSAKLPE